jgi:hypothetical protein
MHTVDVSQPGEGVDSELVTELRRAMAALEEQYRVPVALCCEEGLTQREAAAILGMPESTVSKYVRLGLDRLREMLARAGYMAAPAAVAGALVHTAPVVPVALTSALAEMVSGGVAVKGAAAAGLAKAGSAAVLKGGAIVKIGLGIAAVGLAAGVSLVAMTGKAGDAPAGGLRQEKDASGKEWTLTDWKEGERPYKKALAEREAEYQKKWGESWRGAPHKSQGGNYIMSPGVWKWEEFLVIPDARKSTPLTYATPAHVSQACVYSPGGGAEVTTVWAMAGFGIYHVDAKTKQIAYAGVLPKFEYRGGDPNPNYPKATFLEPLPEPLTDGLDDKARLHPTIGASTVDQVTGRVYFVQGVKRSAELLGRLKGPAALRYAEELRPYTVGGQEMLLPAILDYKEMYKKVGAEPVMKDGKRAPARIAIRTSPIRLDHLNAGNLGRKLMLSPDGRTTWFITRPNWPPKDDDEKHAFEIDTGKDLGALPKFQDVPKQYVADRHWASCGNLDGLLYVFRHPGCGQGPGRLFSIDLKTAQVTRLYDSLMAWPELEEGGSNSRQARDAYFNALRAAGTNDGPADSVSLKFVTTSFAFQCPRTGAVMHGGWDACGIRRYHDGFVTSVAQTPQMNSNSPRPEWAGQNVAAFGSLFTPPRCGAGRLALADRLGRGSLGLQGRPVAVERHAHRPHVAHRLAQGAAGQRLRGPVPAPREARGAHARVREEVHRQLRGALEDLLIFRTLQRAGRSPGSGRLCLCHSFARRFSRKRI